MKTFLSVALLVGTSLAQSHAKIKLREFQSAPLFAASETPLYLPEEKYVKLLTLGFNNFASDVLWFHTVNYFGKQFLGGKDYRWFHQMCRLVTDLNPQATHVYEFCGTLLSWEAKDFTASSGILSSAIIHHPDQWYYLYLRGFNYWYFANRRDLAHKDFIAASMIDEAPPFLASIAARLLVDQDSPQDAVNFLQSMIQQSTDKNAKEALSEKLRSAELARDLWVLKKAIARYYELNGDYPSSLELLVSSRILKKLPTEPYGGVYFTNSATGEVRSTSNQKPLAFSGNVASQSDEQH